MEVAKVVKAFEAAMEAMAAWVVPPPPLVHVQEAIATTRAAGS